MSIEHQFLRDILASPEDDGLRLIYADWLEENGDPDRAEFIRTQITLAKSSRNDPRYEDLEARQDELAALHKEAWGGRVARYVGDFDFCNGLVGFVSASITQLNRHGDRLFAVAPVRMVGLHQLNSKRIAGVAACRHLERIEHLDLSRLSLDPADVGILASSPHLGQLRSLDLSHNSIAVAGFQALLSSPLSRQLTRLDVSQTGMGYWRSERLDWPELPNLETLILESNAWGPARTAEFARAKTLPKLCGINLRMNGIGEAGVELARAPWLGWVKDLHLDYNKIGPEAMRAFAAVPAFRPREFSIDANPVGPGVGVLARSGAFEQAEWLSLRFTSLGPDGIEEMTRAPTPAALRRLWLSGNEITDAGVRALAAWPGLRQVFDLELAEAGITAACLAALLASPHAKSLRKLTLFGNKIGDEGAKALADAQSLEGLRRLNVKDSGITTRGAVALAAARDWQGGLEV